MAYNYLELVNSVARRLNETELTSSNFSTAKGFYANIKDAVNASIRDINQYQLYWPYNHNSSEVTLVAGETRYTVADEAKYVDYDTFRLKRDTDVDIGNARKLRQISYLEYVDRYIDQEDETDTSRGGAPEYVFRTQDGYYGIVPMPDKAYTIEYEYFTYPVDLALFDDVPTIPEPYKHVIVDGAMYYSYMFRDNMEMASISKNKFEEGMKNMRKILVNENVYMRLV
jgi:hypothetical protein